MGADSQASLTLKSQLYPWILLSLLKELSNPHSRIQNRNFQPFSQPLLFSASDILTALHPDREFPERLHHGVNNAVGIHFQSPTGLVNFFENRRVLPGRLRGIRNFPALIRFLSRLLYIQKLLKVESLESLNHAQIEPKVIATLFAACAGINGLIKLDTFTHKLFLSGSRGRVHIRIKGIAEPILYIDLTEEHLICTREKPVADPQRTVDLEYESLETAWVSVSNQADNLALVGKGNIRMRGYVPLADSLNHLLDRLQMFVSL